MLIQLVVFLLAWANDWLIKPFMLLFSKYLGVFFSSAGNVIFKYLFVMLMLNSCFSVLVGQIYCTVRWYYNSWKR